MEHQKHRELATITYWLSTMTIKHHWEKHGLHTQYIGNLTGKELLKAALDTSGHPRFDELRYVIGDWSYALETTTDPADVEELIAYITAMAFTNPTIKNASVMNEKESNQGLVSLYALLARELPWDVRSFHTLQEARVWVREGLS